MSGSRGRRSSASQSRTSADDLVCADTLDIHPLGDGRVLARAASTNRVVLLDATDAMIASLIGHPDLRLAHSKSIANRLGSLNQREVAKRIKNLENAGCLIDVRSVLRKVKRHRNPVQSRSAGPVTFAIPTLGRQVELERLARSLESLGPRPRHVLVSGEWRVTPPARVRQALEGSGAAILSQTDRRKLARRLASKTGTKRQIIEWALCGDGSANAPGANRNAILFTAAPGTLVWLDDDTFLELRSWGSGTRLPSISGAHDPTDLILAKDIADLRGSTRRDDTAQLWPYIDVTGTDPLAIVRQAPEDPSHFRGLTPTLATLLTRDDARIAGVSFGVTGDLGTDSPTDRLRLTGRARPQLVGDPGQYEQLKQTRLGVRMARQLSVGRPVVCQTYAFALDTQRFFPPFLPVGRGEDGLFGLVLQIADRAAFFAYAPIAICHAPGNRQHAYSEGVWRDDSIPLSLLVSDLLTRINVENLQTPATRQEALGCQLEALGALPPQSFWELVGHCALRRRTHEIQQLNACLQTYGTPKCWVADVQSRIEFLETLVFANQRVRVGVTPEADVQRLVRWYGTLLRIWPAILASARSS
jgi:hypothetical protein